MKGIKPIILTLMSSFILCSCSNYDRPQSANLGVCKKLWLEMNSNTHFHNPNATHNTKLTRTVLMQQYHAFDCKERKTPTPPVDVKADAL